LKNRYFSIRSIFIIVLCTPAYSIFAQIFTQDLQFGINGLVKTEIFKNRTSKAYEMSCDSNGNVRMFGTAESPSGKLRIVSIGYKANGALDSNFGVGGIQIYFPHVDTGFSAECVKFTKTKDGGFFAAGYIIVDGGEVDVAVIKIKATGSLDSNWGEKGWCIANLGSRDYANGLVAFPDGSLTVLCRMYKNLGVDSMGIMQIKPNGKIDSVFGWNGHKTVNSEYSMYVTDAVIDGNGKYYWIGNSHFTKNKPVLARFFKNGTPDSTFDVDGFADFGGIEGVMNDIALDLDFKPVVAGYSIESKSNTLSIFRFLDCGIPDSGFSDDGIQQIRFGNEREEAVSILPLNSGRLYVLGKSLDPNGFYKTTFIELAPSGAYSSFLSGVGFWMKHVSARDDGFTSLGIASAGNIFLGGYFSSTNSLSSCALVRLNRSWPVNVQKPYTEGPRIYPNPSAGNLHLYLPGDEYLPTTISIFNTSGQLVCNFQQLGYQHFDMVLNNILPPGLYILKAANNKGTFTSTFVYE